MRCLLLSIMVALFATGCAKNIIKDTHSSTTPCDCLAKTSEQSIHLPVVESPKYPIGENTVAHLPEYGLLKPTKWEDIDGFQQDNLQQAWDAWLASCSVLISKPAWKSVCETAKMLAQVNDQTIRAYFQRHFQAYLATNAEGHETGLITGYYEPVLRGSRIKSSQFPYPLYRQPADLVSVEMGELFPDLKFKRVRGKLVGDKLVPYYKRSEIESNPSPLTGEELVWVDDIIELFFLQIQGSGMIQLDAGNSMHVGYANQNGHAYQSIGKILIARGELNADQASMQGIKNWARNNPGKLRALLHQNPSYVFFRELPTGLPGPIGALGVPISAERSVAIDAKMIPLGAPLFLSTTFPNSNKALKRMMLAQDTGGAIKGGVRADFFWGTGEEAGKHAGAMKQQGKIWVLLPKTMALSNKTATPP